MATEAHERVLPPSANWYYSQICAWGYEPERLLLAFGAKNSVLLYQVRAPYQLLLLLSLSLADLERGRWGARSCSEAMLQRTNAPPRSWRSCLEAQRTSE